MRGIPKNLRAFEVIGKSILISFLCRKNMLNTSCWAVDVAFWTRIGLFHIVWDQCSSGGIPSFLHSTFSASYNCGSLLEIIYILFELLPCFMLSSSPGCLRVHMPRCAWLLLMGGLSARERLKQNFGLDARLAAKRFIVMGSAFWVEDTVHCEVPMKGSWLGSLEYFLFVPQNMVISCLTICCQFSLIIDVSRHCHCCC